MKQKLFTLLTLLVLCVTGAWAQNSETIDCSGASATSSTGNTNKHTSTNYSAYFTRGGGGWSVNSNKGYQGKTDAIAVFKITQPTEVKIIISNNGSSARTFTATAKPFKTDALGDEFLSILDVSYTKPAKYADCVSSSKNYANLETTSAYYNKTTASTYCTLSNPELSTTLSYTTGEQTLAASATSVEYLISSTLPAGVYAIGFSAVSNSAVSFAGIKFTTTSSESYAVSFDAGGHGTAPTTPASASTFTLPTMDADGDYVNTGWTANQTVKVGGNDVAAGTEIAVGTSVTLTAATTFTGVWKIASSFALTSASEVEVAIDGTSTITTSGNAGDVDYESGDLSVATVDGSGEITAVGAGKTTITVKDPGNASTLGKSYTVTVLVPYPNPTAADAYTLDNSQYAFSNSDNTKYYFKNGFAITNTASKAYGSANMGDAGTGMKFSANTAYTINVPSNVTVTYAVFTARNNYGSDKAAANWGTVFGTDYSATALPWSNETPADKDFVITSPSAGGTLAFTPGGNQWQAIITLNTIEYHEKYAVSYAAGEGTGTMAGTEMRGGSKFNLPASTFTAPAEKGFAGWLCDIDNVVYAAGAEYTMTDAATTFTAQYAGVEGTTIIKATPTATNKATVTGSIGGTSEVSLQDYTSSEYGGYKFGGANHRLAVTLAGGKTFKTGDIINIHITRLPDAGKTLQIFDGTGNGKNVIYEEENANGVIGDNLIVLPAAAEGKTTIAVIRTNATDACKWNAYIDYIEVTRPNAVVTLNASGYATYSAASDFEVSAGAKAYKATLNTSDNKITCSEIEGKIPAGAGVLLYGDANAIVTLFNTTGATALEDNDLKGTTTASGSLAAMEGSKYYYALNGDTFKHYTGSAFVADKAYFESDTELNSKAFAIVFESETTGINAIEEVAPATMKTRKVVKNGRLVIETANGEFTVSGARIK